MASISKPHQLLIIYSQEDAPWLARLIRHPILADQPTTLCDVSSFPPGSVWKQEIDRVLGTAHIIIVLVSSRLMISDLFVEELPRWLEAATTQGSKVFWIALDPSLYRPNSKQNLWITDALSSLDKDTQDQILFETSKEIARVAQNQSEMPELEIDLQFHHIRSTSDPDLLMGLSHGELLALSEGMLTPVTQAHLDDLLFRNNQGALTPDEIDELDQVLQRIDHLNLLKAKARYTLEQYSTGSAS